MSRRYVVDHRRGNVLYDPDTDDLPRVDWWGMKGGLVPEPWGQVALWGGVALALLFAFLGGRP